MNRDKIATFFFGRVARNVAFWFLFTALVYSGRGNTYILFPILFFILLFSFGISGYLNNLVLIPQILLKRKYVLYFFCFVLLLLCTGVASYFITQWSNKLVPALDYMGPNKDVALAEHLAPSFLFLLSFATAKFTTDSFLNRRKLELLESQQLHSELETLKSQINPHFLFNSLNTIYGLALRNDASNDSANAIMKLSDILRYVLYESNVPLISIEKEISFLNFYVDFAKLRSNNARINLEVRGVAATRQIAPLILLPFVENAIKHGPGSQIQNSWVSVLLELNDKNLYFECANSHPGKNATEKIQKEKSNGIGLKNVIRRLDLLYAKKHKMEIIDAGSVFKVRLNLELQ